MGDEKLLCPLQAAGQYAHGYNKVQPVPRCDESECAWWVKKVGSDEHECAIKAIARLPELIGAFVDYQFNG